MPDYEVLLTQANRGFDGRTFWAQARAGTIPPCGESPPTVVLTAQPTLRTGDDVFYGLSEWRTADLGKTWSGPVDHADTLGRRQENPETVVGICDMTPGWHAKTGVLLSTGHTVRYADDRGNPLQDHPRETAYSAYDAQAHTWTPWRALKMPAYRAFANAGAGSTQRFDLEDGSILLPIYYKQVSDNSHDCCAATVLRCVFDGKTLTYCEHGSELTIEEPRGFCEPSITRCAGRYYLTLRNDVRGYVSAGDDGLYFPDPVCWRFDDGEELGNYNTQQHWVTHADQLYLVYTRKGMNNDHVFRHRAPLVMAEVDPATLRVRRATERELVPNRGARLGNFSVCNVTENETWVVVAEWMQPIGCEHYGSDNTIWAARIQWKERT